jgi:alkylation response protein AidB-like acyl-CoA dehydrogenase
MYDLRLTPEQLEFRDTVRDFIEAEVKPVLLHPARLEPLEKPFPADILDKAARIGLRTLALSEELGGAGADSLTTCIVMEELGAGDPDIAMTLGTTAHLAHLLFDRLTTPGQRSRLLPAFLDDDRAHLALAGAEPAQGAGWHYHRSAEPHHSPISAVRETDGRWRLDGQVAFVANAPIASSFIVRARAQDEGGGARDLTLLVPKATPGLRVDALHARGTNPAGGRSMIAWYHGIGAALTLERCRVPGDSLLADDAGEDAHAHRSAQIAAMNLGVGRAAFEAAVDYAKLRVQGGRPIVQHQSIGTLLADSAIKLENARNLVWKAAWACDHPEAIAERSVSELPLAIMARVYTAEAMHEVALAAAECFGAMGVMRDMPLQKYVHDTLVFLHGAGHDNATRLEIAESISGFRRDAA